MHILYLFVIETTHVAMETKFNQSAVRSFFFGDTSDPIFMKLDSDMLLFV